MKYVLESCVDTVESAFEAKAGGANRLELCGNLVIGGTTPDLHVFNLLKEKVDIKINVLIRPRFGDFYYSDYEFETMKKNIERFRQAGANGVVIGMLNTDGSLDVERMKELIDVAKGIDVTLHRAFDVCRDAFEALEQAKQLGINTILTSGQRDKCIDGQELIKELVEKANKEVDILVGGGVSPDVIDEMLSFTKATSFHLSGKVTLDSPMEFRRENVSMGLAVISEYDIWRTDRNKIAAVRDAIETYLAG